MWRHVFVSWWLGSIEKILEGINGPLPVVPPTQPNQENIVWHACLFGRLVKFHPIHVYNAARSHKPSQTKSSPRIHPNNYARNMFVCLVKNLPNFWESVIMVVSKAFKSSLKEDEKIWACHCCFKADALSTNLQLQQVRLNFIHRCPSQQLVHIKDKRFQPTGGNVFCWREVFSLKDLMKQFARRGGGSPFGDVNFWQLVHKVVFWLKSAAKLWYLPLIKNSEFFHHAVSSLQFRIVRDCVHVSV